MSPPDAEAGRPGQVDRLNFRSNLATTTSSSHGTSGGASARALGTWFDRYAAKAAMPRAEALRLGALVPRPDPDAERWVSFVERCGSQDAALGRLLAFAHDHDEGEH
jgi:hypothetical protein